MKLTVVGPEFFSYTKAIVSELCDMGIEARCFDERGSSSFFRKAVFRSGFLRSLFYFVIKWRHRQIFNEIHEYESSHVLFISPDSLDVALVERLEKTGVTVALYMWDSFENKPNVVKALGSIKRKASFDPVDVNNFGLSHIGLFAESDFFCDNGQLIERSFDLTFIGTAHSNRPEILKDLIDHIAFEKMNTKIHLFSGNLYYGAVARMKLYNCFSLQVTSEKLTKSECAALFRSSRYILDITHKDQRGLTSRTFEALAAGCCLITNNSWALQLLPEFSDRIIVFSESSVPDIASFCWEEANYSDIQKQHLTLNNFCLKLIDLLN